MFDSLWPHGLQRARLPCPSFSLSVCSNSCPSSVKSNWPWFMDLSFPGSHAINAVWGLLTGWLLTTTQVSCLWGWPCKGHVIVASGSTESALWLSDTMWSFPFHSVLIALPFHGSVLSVCIWFKTQASWRSSKSIWTSVSISSSWFWFFLCTYFLRISFSMKTSVQFSSVT